LPIIESNRESATCGIELVQQRPLIWKIPRRVRRSRPIARCDNG
jgi:hypothetical protein